jgi:hypothetical protein
LWNQLSTAFNTALQNAEQTGNTANLASVLQTAGNQVLQNNGINPATFEQEVTGQTQAAHHHHHHHHGGSGSAGQTSDSSSQTTGVNTASDATTQTGASTTTTATQQTSNQQQFADWLTQVLSASGTSGGNQSINGFLFNAQT